MGTDVSNTETPNIQVHCDFGSAHTAGFERETATSNTEPRETNLGRRRQCVRASLVCVVHQLLQIFQVLQKKNESQLVAAVAFIVVCSRPLTDVLIGV